MKTMKSNIRTIIMTTCIAIVILSMLTHGTIADSDSSTEPVYGTIYYGTLIHYDGDWLGVSYILTNFDNAVSYKQEYTGQGAQEGDLGKEYTFTTTDAQGRETPYYKVRLYEIHTKTDIVRYYTKPIQKDNTYTPTYDTPTPQTTYTPTYDTPTPQTTYTPTYDTPTPQTTNDPLVMRAGEYITGYALEFAGGVGKEICGILFNGC